MDSKTILKKSPKATYQNVAGEAILIHLDTGTYFSLNKVGTEFWELIDGSTSIGDHAAKLAAQYDVEATMVATDLVELAEKMHADDLVEIQ